MLILGISTLILGIFACLVIGANICAFPCLIISFFWVLQTRWWIHWRVWWSWWVRPMRQNWLFLRQTFLCTLNFLNSLISLNRLQTLGFRKIIFSYSTLTWNKLHVKRETRIWSNHTSVSLALDDMRIVSLSDSE